MKFNTATYIENMLGGDVDVEFGFDNKPANVWIRILENKVHTKTVHLFREDDGEIHLVVFDNISQMDDVVYVPGGNKIIDEVLK